MNAREFEQEVARIKDYVYSKKCTLIDHVYDVIVAGGGTAGSTAAIAAAIEGADTLIIEKNCFLGGTASGGQVTPMMHSGISGNADGSFVNALLKKKLSEKGYCASDPYENDGWINPEMLKVVLEEIYLEYNGQILYETEFVDAIVDKGCVIGIIVHNKAGMQVIRAKTFIDCTADAEVAFSAGVPCLTGNEKDGRNQLSSLRFMAGNVDVRKLEGFLRKIEQSVVLEYPFLEMACEYGYESPLGEIFKKAVKEGVLEKADADYIQAFSVPGMPGVLSFNCPEVPDIYDSLNPHSRSQISIIGKQMIERLFGFLKAHIPGFEESFVLSIAVMPGIRESRRIKGKYVLTEMDYLNRAKFEDGIARSAYPIDIHGLTDEARPDIKPLERGEFFEVPFRCLVPENIGNLLVAGRCISSTFVAQSSIRIQATCRATGEAAGVAAAYCAKRGIDTSELDGKLVRERMKLHVSFL